MTIIKCFFLEEIPFLRRYLRRYTNSVTQAEKCSINNGYHNAEEFLDDIDVDESDEKFASGDLFPHDDKRWPASCKCGYIFTNNDIWQLFVHRLYIRKDTKEAMTLHFAPPGAMWYADWLKEAYKGQDGMVLIVKTPGGDWCIDGRASNCANPKDVEHHCWIRHGIPPNITVDKNGNTCKVGAGSISIGNIHGHLRNGQLEID